ncbi:hypothetical protein ACTFIY_010515 [Dictyostelium cf. discoideum]
MGKRKPTPINIGSFDKKQNKKLKFTKQNPDQQQQEHQQEPQQPIKKYKSKREKEIHQMIDKIKSERLLIYKNAERHLKLGLAQIDFALSLPTVLKELHTALAEFDAIESSLEAELESLKISVRNASAISVLPPPINHVNTSIDISAAAAAPNINNNHNTIATTTTTTTTTTTINNDKFTSTTNTLPVSYIKRTTATLLDVNSLITATLRPTTSTTATIGTYAATDDTTTIDGTNTAISTTTIEQPRRLTPGDHPPSVNSNFGHQSATTHTAAAPANTKACYACGTTITAYWRRCTYNGQPILLCNYCDK